jgi:hypothetical protein
MQLAVDSMLFLCLLWIAGCEVGEAEALLLEWSFLSPASWCHPLLHALLRELQPWQRVSPKFEA